MTGQQRWHPRGIRRGSPWAVQFRLPIAAQSGLLTLARPDGARSRPIAAVAAVVTGGNQQLITFSLTGADTLDLPVGLDTLADVWIWPVTGDRFPLFRTSICPVRDSVAELVGFTAGTGTGQDPDDGYPSADLYPSDELYPAAS
jgi:hypothetical protein